MPVTITESDVSRPFSVGLTNSSRELIYDVLGTTDESVVLNTILATAPAVYDGLILESASADPVAIDETTGLGIWKGHARYVRPQDEYTFDIGGGSQKITNSLATISSYPAPGLIAPDFQGSINVSDDRVEGVEIDIPTYNFSETHYFSDITVTDAYKMGIFNLMNTPVNISMFRTFAAGECRILGVSGTKRASSQWALTFRFSCIPNVTGLSIGPITGISKIGWDYLWIRYADYHDSTASCLVKRPIAAYVERVYGQGDFSILGI